MGTAGYLSAEDLVHLRCSPPASSPCLWLFGPCFLSPPLFTCVVPEEILSTQLLLTECACGIQCSAHAEEALLPVCLDLFPLELLTPRTSWLFCFASSSGSSSLASLLDSQPERDDGHTLHLPPQLACSQFCQIPFTSKCPLSGP